MKVADAANSRGHCTMFIVKPPIEWHVGVSVRHNFTDLPVPKVFELLARTAARAARCSQCRPERWELAHSGDQGGTNLY
jgi:hypothetical protein